MKLKIIRMLSGIMVVILLAAFCVPVFASSGFTYNQKTTFYHWFKDVPFIGNWIGYTSGKICVNSEDGYHHANSYKSETDDGLYICICTYCGHEFTAYESDLQQSYNDYVNTLPAPVYQSDGSLLIVPGHYWSSFKRQSGFDGSSYFCDHKYGNLSGPYVQFNCDDNNIVARLAGNVQSIRFYDNPRCDYRLVCPINGMYSMLYSRSYSGYYVTTDGVQVPFSVESSLRDDTPVYRTAGSFFDSFFYCGGYPDVDITYYYTQYSYPVYKVVPSNLIIDEINSTYNVTTRPTTITGGNYGIVGDDGQLTVVNGDIINETNNTYYNPATGQSGTINNWSYDYSDRSYNLTLDSGNTVTVRYGNENITIIEGDVTYIIYYIMDGSGSGSGSGDMCEHEWYQTGHREGNCLTSEQRTYTCSKCGKQYTETDPAPGHSWRIIQDVSTKYDESGNLIQEGYTVYECERCKEQYKATNNTGPPGSSGDSDSNGESIWDKIGKFFGTILGGIIGMIEAVISKILDGLISLAEMIMDKLTAVVDVVLSVFDELPKLFGGFLDFLGLVFPYIPSEIMLLLTFGIIAVVFIGIIKALRR